MEGVRRIGRLFTKGPGGNAEAPATAPAAQTQPAE